MTITRNTVRVMAVTLVVGALVALGLTPAVADPPAFVSTWQTDMPGESGLDQISLPLVANGTYDFTVAWGDSAVDHITAWDQVATTHTYPDVGSYTVTITGTLVGWSFHDEGDRQKITGISQWGPLNFGDTGGAFSGAINLRVSATDVPDLSGVTTLADAFSDCAVLTSLGGVWDTGSITDMSGLFRGAQVFNQDIGAWNTSQVTSMSAMFDGALAFNRDIGNWDTSQVRSMNRMFASTSFNRDIGAWDTSHVVTMQSMFFGARAFDQDISSWDTSQVADMSGMFAYAQSFSHGLNGWDTGNVLDMQQMFVSAHSFNGDIGQWDTSQVTDMTMMFGLATAFNRDIGAWNTGAVASMGDMFLGATAFAQDIGRWDTSQVVYMSGMFTKAEAFDQDLGQWQVRNLADAQGMFDEARLSTANYSQLLKGWATQDVNPDVKFSGGTSTYDITAVDARATLTSAPHAWRITDGGLTTAPEFRALPGAVNFGRQRVDTRSDWRPVTVRNVGTAPLRVNRIHTSGVDRSQFPIRRGACVSARIRTGQTCRVLVAFAPTTRGSAEAAVAFDSNAADSPHRIAVTGTGRSVVLPTPRHVRFTPKENRRTVVRWKASSGASNYDVVVRGRKVARVTGTRATITGTFGPDATITVVARASGAASPPAVALFHRPQRAVLVTTVWFSARSSRLNAAAHSRLRHAAATISRQRFRRVRVDGYADRFETGGSAAHRLAAARAAAVGDFLRARVPAAVLVITHAPGRRHRIVNDHVAQSQARNGKATIRVR